MKLETFFAQFWGSTGVGAIQASLEDGRQLWKLGGKQPCLHLHCRQQPCLWLYLGSVSGCLLMVMKTSKMLNSAGYHKTQYSRLLPSFPFERRMPPCLWTCSMSWCWNWLKYLSALLRKYQWSFWDPLMIHIEKFYPWIIPAPKAPTWLTPCKHPARQVHRYHSFWSISQPNSCASPIRQFMASEPQRKGAVLREGNFHVRRCCRLRDLAYKKQAQNSVYFVFPFVKHSMWFIMGSGHSELILCSA